MKGFGTTFLVFIFCFMYVGECNVISLGSMLGWLEPKLRSIFGAYGRYSGYGCYCGIGGSGVPVDKIDCCCQMHDACYQGLADEGTCTTGETFSHLYTFSKYTVNGKPQIKCKESDDACATQLCECDRQVAMCLAIHDSKTYNVKYKNYERHKKCAKEKWLEADFCPK